MAIQIESISFENYRQYGTLKLNFPKAGSTLLSIIIAKNGTGKTTLLNAITWCLYGEELLTDDNLQPLPLINTTIKNISEIGSVQDVSVTLKIIDGDQQLEFKRTQKYRIREGLEPLKGKETFVVSMTDPTTFTNTQNVTGNDAAAVVTQYFDRAIFKYYFFDGERLQDFFSAENSTSIRDAIYNISQVTLLETTCKHLSTIESDIIKAIGKQAPNIEEHNQQVEGISADIDQLKKSLEQEKKSGKSISDDLEHIEQYLRAQKPIQDLQNERADLEAEDKELDRKMDDLHAERCTFIQEYIVLLKLYPRIKRTLAYITEKEQNGELPPAIDREQLQQVLSSPGMPCPFCNNPIDDKALDHLKELMRLISISSRTSHTLKEYKGSLEDCLEQVKQFKAKKEKLNETAASYEARKRDIQKRLEEISKLITGMESDSTKRQTADYEQKRTDLKIKLRTTDNLIGNLEQQIEQKKKELESAITSRDQAVQRSSKFASEQAKLHTIEMLRNRYQAIKKQIIEQMRSEISDVTWTFFDEMIWKRNTFGHIEISDTYDVTVFDKAGSVMTGSLSATEKMALAYAFTLAIHGASGRNCPLVIDSPLGRVSDANRENMAAALLDVSRNKQIIMLFTPDEYSDNVRNIYDNYVGVCELNLNEDETFIEGGE